MEESSDQRLIILHNAIEFPPIFLSQRLNKTGGIVPSEPTLLRACGFGLQGRQV